MKSEANVPSSSSLVWYLMDCAQGSILGRHWAYFLTGWLMLVRWDWRVPQPKRKSGWMEFLSLAGPQYWPVMLVGFVLFIVALLLLMAKAVGLAQPALMSAGELSANVWWGVLFLALSFWRYLKGKACLRYLAAQSGVILC